MSYLCLRNSRQDLHTLIRFNTLHNVIKANTRMNDMLCNSVCYYLIENNVMKKLGLHQSYKAVVVFCLLLFAVAYFLNLQNTADKEIGNEVSRHIKVTRIANDISSYAKRAEGHMLLYLLLEKETDREKVGLRLDKLGQLIDELEVLVKNDQSGQLLKQLRQNHQGFSVLYKIVLQQYDNEKVAMFSSDKGAAQIEELHSLSSDIRKIGVKLVDSSTSRLEHSKDLINNKNINKYRALVSFTVITFIFLIVITYQSGKLTISSQVTDTLEKLSYIDPLTKVGNRRYFDEEMNKEWRRAIRNGSSLSLLFIDVDHFKSYNDTYGHSAGDTCLTSIAQTLKGRLKRSTDILARYGGEEFVAILPETRNPMQIAEKCRKAIEQMKIQHSGSDISDVVTISIGVGIIAPEKDSNPDTFIKLVDENLYEAKNRGRNRVFMHKTARA